MNAQETSSRLLARWWRFNFVGAIGIAVQLATLAFLKTGLQLHYIVATALAVEAAVIHNFIWHERYTWADRRSRTVTRRFIIFNATNGATSVLGNLVLMKLLVERGHLPYLLANMLAIAACSFANFLLSDRFAFRIAKRPAAKLACLRSASGN